MNKLVIRLPISYFILFKQEVFLISGNIILAGGFKIFKNFSKFIDTFSGSR